jgi:hypothetical protein
MRWPMKLNLKNCEARNGCFDIAPCELPKSQYCPKTKESPRVFLWTTIAKPSFTLLVQRSEPFHITSNSLAHPLESSKETTTMMHRSKVDLQSSCVNASWDMPIQKDPIPHELSSFINPKACTSGLYLLLQPTPTATTSPAQFEKLLQNNGKRRLKDTLSHAGLDCHAIDRLLRMLPLDEDYYAHTKTALAPHLSPPLHRQQSSLSSLPLKRPKSHFKQALETMRSTPHLSSSESVATF